MRTLDYPFTEEDSTRAHDTWGANCGPNAFAFALGLHIDKVRGMVPGFEAKCYTNPTMMRKALELANTPFTSIAARKPRLGYCADIEPMFHQYTALVRIQWEGPWTEPDANPRWAYRHTHWVTTWLIQETAFLFDVNGGVRALQSWESEIVPLLTSEISRADGHWYPTHIYRLKTNEWKTT